MANCPKCGKHLKLINWKQNCPYCHTNIFVYDQQERLMRDADIAEVQYYHFQKKIDRVKASFVGSKLAIVRIFASVLPVAAPFLPLVNARVSAPFPSAESEGITLATLVNKIDVLTGDAFPTLLTGDNKTSAILLISSLAMLILSLLALVLHFLCLTLSCSPKGKQRNIAFDVLYLFFAIGSATTFLALPQSSPVYGSLGLGTYLYFLLLIVSTVVDIVTIKKGIPINHKPCFVGGIPIEEYFEMVEKGMPTEEIRKIQYERMQAIEDEKAAKAEEEYNSKTKEEATTNA